MKFDGQPYLLLNDIAKKVEESARNQPLQKDFNDVWSGVGFLSCGCLMSAAMGEVTEIITVPKYTSVPGAKSWVMGIANVRGALVPIIDLEQFFGYELVGNRRNHRVLIVEHFGTRVGLVVSKLIGMQHLDQDVFEEPDSNLKSAFSPYIEKSYKHNEEDWFRFSPSRLFESEEFINASAASAGETVIDRIAAA